MLTLKTQERRQQRRFAVFIVHFEHILYFLLVLSLLILDK